MTSVIFVLDDEPDIELLFRQQFCRDLRARRFDMDFVRPAAQALRRALETDDRTLALILSDINMPGMSGLDMLPQMRARLPDVPVIMVSAYGDSQTCKTALERGADDLLVESIDFGRLCHEIEARLGAAA
ncbi:response regulator [Bradyrhizobium sp. McL0616]|uniref:response regulator n=1 Tax=Bradyrhizobium sp. McL0616 TaxID=3415674 RepID=UPI003CF06641